MKKFQLKNKQIKLSLILFLLLISIGSGLVINNAQAADVNFVPQVSIPGSNFQKGVTTTLEANTGPIARYISAIYNYGVGIVGIVAAMMLMIGGIIWLTAAGSSSKIEQGKSFIFSSLTGMALVLTAYILLNTINPELVNFKSIAIDSVKEVNLGCCQLSSGAEMMADKDCTAKQGTVVENATVSKGMCEAKGCCTAILSKEENIGGVLSQKFYINTTRSNCTMAMLDAAASKTITVASAVFATSSCQTVSGANVSNTCDCTGQEDGAGVSANMSSCGNYVFYRGKCYQGSVVLEQGDQSGGDPCGNHGDSTCQDCNSIDGGKNCSITNNCLKSQTWDLGGKSCKAPFDCCHN